MYVKSSRSDPSPAIEIGRPSSAFSMKIWPTRRLTQRGPYSAEGRTIVYGRSKTCWYAMTIFSPATFSAP